MLLHRLHLDLHCREVRRDLADPYQMHATLCRGFVPDDQKCPPGTFLWRLEPEAGPSGAARVLVQSHTSPDWSRIEIQG
jgi:CRISPR system Cascade subunit CasE